jgi:hypothetical protein
MKMAPNAPQMASSIQITFALAIRESNVNEHRFLSSDQEI